MFKDGSTQSQIQKSQYIRTQELGSWFIQSGIMKAKSIYSSNKDNKVIFGGKRLLINRSKGLISKQQFKQKRMNNLNIQGQASKNGNRHFNLNIIQNNEIIFKPFKGKKINIKLPKLKNNLKKQLYNLQLRSQNKQQPYQIELGRDYIYITFEPIKQNIKLIKSRFVGVDLNPSNIGISIIQNDKILFSRHYQFKRLIDNIVNLNQSSNSKALNYHNNKRTYQLIHVCKDIQNLVKQYKCKYIFVQDLTIKSQNHSKGRLFNRKVNNLWNRNLVINNLQKRMNIIGGKLFKVNPAYSSYIGNLKYQFSDPINASIEIGRRGYNVIILKNKKFYPDLDIHCLKYLWKEQFKHCVKSSWKEFCLHIKNSKVKYRVSLQSLSDYRVFSLNNTKSYVKLYSFYQKCII